MNICFCVAYAELITNARSAVSLANASVGFSCCTDTTVRIYWHFNYPHDKKVHVVYNGHSVHPDLQSFIRVRFDSSTGCSHLDITTVKVRNAGRYYCLESNTARRKLRFYLIVLGQYYQPHACNKR